jgi:cellobiose epimerase
VSANSVARTMRAEMERELVDNILPFWMREAVDERHDGFVGFIAGDGTRNVDASKGSILNARILWTFSAAHRVLGADGYRVVADRAARYLGAHFVDAEHGGVRWMVRADGTALDDRKHVYAQAFAIYGLSEHFRATAEPSSLQLAIGLFRLLERHAYDTVHGGYEEAFDREWVPLDDVRLSEEDADERRSMNTHLHVLEAFANLYRVWPDPLLRHRLVELVELFLARIIDACRGHLHLFFDRDWTPKSEIISFGHDIEASWLLLEAADVLGDDALRARVLPRCIALARAALAEAIDPAGGIYNEAAVAGALDTDKEWWPQAEAIVGFFNAYQESGAEELLLAAERTWDFTKRHIVDRTGGDWHRRVARDGSVRPGHEKVGPWKCPYHNARACLEIMARVGADVPAGDRT